MAEDKQTFLIEIKSTADLKAAKEAEKILRDAIKAAADAKQPTQELEQKLKAVETALQSEAAKAVEAGDKTQKAGDAFAKAAGQTNKFEEQLKEAASEIPGFGRAIELLKNPITAVIALLASFLTLVKQSIQEFAGSEIALKRLETAMAQFGQLTKANSEAYKDLATQMQYATGIADEEWLGVIRKLVQAGARPESIGMNVEAVKNLAGVMEGDLIGAATLWGKALQGNFEQFSRYGIVVDKSASQHEKLAQVMADLKIRGGGQLEMVGTLSQGWNVLKNDFSDVMEQIGEMASGFLELRRVMELGSYWLRYWIEDMRRQGQFLDELTGGFFGFSRAIDEYNQKQRQAISTADELERIEADKKESLEGVKKAADDARDSFNRLMDAQKAYAASQQVVADLEMQIALERLKAMNLNESVRIRAEQIIRQRAERAKSDAAIKEKEVEIGMRGKATGEAEGAASSAREEASAAAKRAADIEAASRKQALADELSKQAADEAASFNDDTVSSPKLFMTEADVAQWRRSIIEMQQRAAAAQRDASRARSRLGGDVESVSVARARASAADEKAKAAEEEAANLKRENDAKVEQLQNQIMAERKQQQLRDELARVRSGNEQREQAEKAQKEAEAARKRGERPEAQPTPAQAAAQASRAVGMVTPRPGPGLPTQGPGEIYYNPTPPPVMPMAPEPTPELDYRPDPNYRPTPTITPEMQQAADAANAAAQNLATNVDALLGIGKTMNAIVDKIGQVAEGQKKIQARLETTQTHIP